MLRRDKCPAFGYETPSINLKLAQEGNITSIELLAFFPEDLRCYDPVLRLVQNGLNQKIAANVINSHRDWEKRPAEPDTVCKIIEKTMRSHSGKKRVRWTMSGHLQGKWSYDYKTDDDDLTLTGLRAQCEIDPKFSKRGHQLNPVIEGIPFRNLAPGIARYPSIAQGDGLDLTECVKYAAAHPEENLVYPRDFASLTEKLGGPLQVRREHTDKEALLRWKQSRNRDDEPESDDEDFTNIVFVDSDLGSPDHEMLDNSAEGQIHEDTEALSDYAPQEYYPTPEETSEARPFAPFCGPEEDFLYRRQPVQNPYTIPQDHQVGFRSYNNHSAVAQNLGLYAAAPFFIDSDFNSILESVNYIVSGNSRSLDGMPRITSNVNQPLRDDAYEPTEHLEPSGNMAGRLFDGVNLRLPRAALSRRDNACMWSSPAPGYTTPADSPPDLSSVARAVFDDLPDPVKFDLWVDQDTEEAQA